MHVAQTSTGYAVSLDATEREQLLTACEYALSRRRGERDGERMLLELDAAALDSLTDRLFLIGYAAM